MRFYLFFFLLGGVLPASAQVFVNKVDVNSRAVQYIEVWEKHIKSSDKFFAMLDYGQLDDVKNKTGENLYVTNMQGQYLEFNGIVDVLNFMYRNGWEVLHVKTIGDYESYILKKKAIHVSAQVVKEPNKNSKNPKDIVNTQKTVEHKQTVKEKEPGNTTEID